MPKLELLDKEVVHLLTVCNSVKPDLKTRKSPINSSEIQNHLRTAIKELETILQSLDDSANTDPPGTRRIAGDSTQINREDNFYQDDLKEELKGYEEFQNIEERKEKHPNYAVFLDKIINTIIDPIFVKDNERRWVLINNACADYFQIKREQIIGKTDTELFPKEVVDDMRTIELEVLKTGRDCIREEFVEKSGGRKHTIVVKKSLCVAPDGQKFIVGIFDDITDKKEWERKLKEQNESLKKVNSELDSFVYRTSHDLRSPLTSVLGLINVSRLESDDAVKRLYLDLMEKSIKKLDTFIQDILNYSRNSRVERVLEDIDFRVLINDILDGLKFMEGYDTLEKIVDVTQDTSFVSDLFRIKIIFNNLISNSIKYRSIIVEKPFISIKVIITEESGIFEFADNGKGIAKESVKRIFDMFYRASNTSMGSGLGLYIVKETVKALNGEITVESEMGGGTTFRVLLPNNVRR